MSNFHAGAPWRTRNNPRSRGALVFPAGGTFGCHSHLGTCCLASRILGPWVLEKKHVHVDVQNTSRMVLKGFKTKLWKLCVIQCKQEVLWEGNRHSESFAAWWNPKECLHHAATISDGDSDAMDTESDSAGHPLETWQREAAKEVIPTATAIALGHADHAMKNEDLGPWHHRCRGCSRQMLAVAKTMAEEQLEAAMLENTDGHDASTGDLFWFFLTSLGFHFCYNDRASFPRWIGLIAFHCYIHCYPDFVIHLPVNKHRHSNEWNITGSIGTCHFRVPECTSPSPSQ